MSHENKYLSEIFPIINQLYEDEEPTLVIRKFCSRSIKFRVGLGKKYQRVKNRIQKEDYCKEEEFLSILGTYKKTFLDYKGVMAIYLSDSVIEFVVREILDCDVEHNPALLDLYLDFVDGIDLSYNEEDVLDAIRSNKSREELKRDLEEVLENKIYQDEIREMEIYSKGLNYIKSFLQKELTPDDISNLNKWIGSWKNFTVLEPTFQYILTYRLVKEIEKYQRATEKNSVNGLEKASKSIKSLLSDLINTNESGVNLYQPKIPEKREERIYKPKRRVKKVTVTKPPLEKRIIEELSKGKKVGRQLSEALGESGYEVVGKLHKMKEKGIVNMEGVFWVLSEEKKGS